MAAKKGTSTAGASKGDGEQRLDGRSFRDGDEGERAALRERPEYQKALRILAQVEGTLRLLEDPETEPSLRERLITWIHNVATTPLSAPTAAKKESRRRLEHLFFHLDGWGQAFEGRRARSDAGGSSGSPRTSSECLAKRVVESFSLNYPHEPVDLAALTTAIEEWVVAPEKTASKRGGRRAGRTGKFNAIEAAIKGTSFALRASSIEQAFKDWRKKQPRAA